jgi:hypothetical protein
MRREQVNKTGSLEQSATKMIDKMRLDRALDYLSLR